jgi:hypothetical protein
MFIMLVVSMLLRLLWCGVSSISISSSSGIISDRCVASHASTGSNFSVLSGSCSGAIAIASAEDEEAVPPRLAFLLLVIGLVLLRLVVVHTRRNL